MGIGGGWYEHEWRAYGYGFPPAGDRLGALREGVQIFRDMWTTGSATLDGKYYQVDGALCAPAARCRAPRRRAASGNGIPMWIAGGGEKVTLKIAAQYADYTNFDGDAEVFDRKSELLRGHCDDLGRDFGSIVRSANYNVVIGETEADVEDRLPVLRRAAAQGRRRRRHGRRRRSRTCASSPPSARRTRSSRCSRTWRRAG